MLGVATIGQSPRPDLVAAFGAFAPPGVRVKVRGALDDVPTEAIDALASHPTDYPLLVRLADGTTRAIGRNWLHPFVVDAAQRLAADGVQAVVIACAGDFPDVALGVPVVLPGRVIPDIARALCATRRVGVVTPIREQVAAATAKWHADGFDPVVTWAAPDDDEALDRAADLLRDADVQLVVLDCMGHADAAAQRLEARSGVRVLPAQSLCARIAGELLRPPAPASAFTAIEDEHTPTRR